MERLKSWKVKTAAWSSLDPKEKGFECVWLTGSSASGSIVRLDEDGQPLRVTYQFQWDSDFRMKEALIQTLKDHDTKELALRYEQGWLKENVKLNEFNSCQDLDLWPTPLTNTFALRRLNLSVGESRNIDALWIHGPTLGLGKVSQIYSRLDDRHYLFEDPAAEFQACLTVDQDGLVVHYPGLFNREA
jgi:uncharacterized protein